VYNPSSYAYFSITTWTLINFEQMQWRKDATIKSTDFWAALDMGKRLPCILPEFPIMSLVDPNVIRFMLEDNNHIYWLIEVNTKNKILGAATLYINEEEEEGYTANMFRGEIFYGNSFVTSQFTVHE
jgi:membrane-bound lytic murein transglycosylase MltF